MKRFIYIIGIIIVFASCKDNCPAKNDPCIGLSERIGDFKILAGIRHLTGTEYVPPPFSGGGEYTNWVFGADTVLGPFVYLQATDGYDSVKWNLEGENTYRYGSDLGIDFGNFEGTLQVTMIGYRTVNSECFPSEKPIDTLTKPIVFYPIDSSLFFGKWRGSFDDRPQDSFDIEITRVRGHDYILNFPQDSYKSESNKYGLEYRHFWPDDNSPSSFYYPDKYNRSFQEAYFKGEVIGKDSLIIIGRYKYIGTSDDNFYNLNFNAKRI